MSIKKHTGKVIAPWWEGNIERGRMSEPKKGEAYNVVWGIMGIIPKDLIYELKNRTGCSKEMARGIAGSWSTKILKSMHKRWIERCNASRKENEKGT